MRTTIFLVLTFVPLCSTVCHAETLLDGKTITTAFYFPNTNTIGFGGVPVDSVVGPGVEIAASPQGYPITTIDFSDTSILLTFTATLSGTSANFNGWRFYDSTGTIQDFVGATITTTNPGWSITEVDADNIWLNGQGSTYASGSTLQIDIVSIPEPSTLVLGSIGLLGLLGLGWRRKQ